MKKQALATLILGLIAFAPLGQAQSTFSDLDESNENFVAIEYLVETGTLEGYEDNTFQADKTINRAELMKIIVSGQGIEPDEETYQSCFPDVQTDWYAKYVCYAFEQGWVSGYDDNTFKPAQTVNKVEALKMLINGMGLESELAENLESTLFEDVDGSAWYAPFVHLAQSRGLLEVNDGAYSPGAEMNRGLVSEYLFRTLVSQEADIGIYSSTMRDLFLEDMDMSHLIPEGKAEITMVFYDGEVYEVESDEYVEITNTGQGFLHLDGHSLSGSKGDDRYDFESVSLDANESIIIYTNQGDYSFESADALWSNSGETVYLYDEDENLVDSYSY
jgi:hypothetical protein